LSELPLGWVETTLGDLVSPDQSTTRASDGSRPYLGLEHVESQSTKVLRTGDSASIKSATKPFAPGHTLYSRLRPYLNKVCAPDFEGVASTEFINFGPSPWLAPKYLLYLLNSPSFVAYANQNAEGIERPRLSWARMAGFPAGLPPLNEQRRIVTVIEEHLSRLDAADAFARLSSQRLRALSDTVSQGVGRGYARVMLGNLIREPLRNGHSAKAATNGTVRTLTLSAVTRREFIDENTKLTAADPRRVKSLWLEPGDVLIERSNTPELVGTAALYKGPREWAIFPDLLIRVRVGDSVLPEFLEIVLRARPARRYFQRAAQGIAGSMPKIDQGVVERLEVPVPPLEEQRRIVAEVEERLSAVDALRAAIERAQRRSAALRRAVLERAFRGELVPQDPSDEPAEALLARIRAEAAIAAKPAGR
jgi:type I restriction enzyme S subunit